MRTQEQLMRLRFIMVNIHGPLALLLSDKDIDDWANQLEKGLQKQAIATWEVFIRFDNVIDPWEMIPKEPSSPTCSMYAIKEKCMKLLSEHPNIKEFKIVNENNKEEFYIFERLA